MYKTILHLECVYDAKNFSTTFKSQNLQLGKPTLS